MRALSIGLGLLFSFLTGCGSSGATAGVGGASSTSSSASGLGGKGGGAPTCDEVACTKPGEICVAGACVADCRKVGAEPCAAGTVCDASDANPGKCVDPAAPCVTASAPEICGDRVCGSGSACDGAGKCYSRIPCTDVDCDDKGCWGTGCQCTRAMGCAPAPLGAPGAKGTLHDDAFRKGLVDLEFAPDCSAWGVTLISGPDYLRSIAPDGAVQAFPGVTNLNMGEVSVLQQILVPKSAHPGPPAPPPDLDVALTYICCSACGCMLGSTPQGVARLDPMTATLPLLVPSKTFTDGKGPFGNAGIDTGPSGLSYGTDRVLYVGNVDVNGDYYRLDLATSVQSLVTTFKSRVYASAPYDAISMLVALEGGEIRLLRLPDATSTVWTTSDQPVVGMVRDFFDGAVYVARQDKGIWKYGEDGKGALWQTAKNPARISLAPDGWLYALEIPAPFADITPTVARWQLPLTR